jgi:hypothetical protein
MVMRSRSSWLGLRRRIHTTERQPSLLGVFVQVSLKTAVRASVSVLALATVAACSADRVGGPDGAYVANRAPSLQNVALRGEVLADFRKRAFGCVFTVPAGNGKFRVMALPYNAVPLELPRIALPRDGAAPGMMRHTMRRIEADGELVSIACTVPNGTTQEQFVFAVNASSGPRWRAIGERLARFPARDRIFGAPLPEATQVRYELLGTEGPTGMTATASAGSLASVASSGSATSGSLRATRISTPELRGTCGYEAPPPEEPPPLPLVETEPTYLNPQPPLTYSTPIVSANRVRGSLDCALPSYSYDLYYNDGYDVYGATTENLSNSDPSLSTGESTAPCYYDCGSYVPPPEPEETCVTKIDKACLDTLRTLDRALIDSALALHFNDSASAFCHELRDRFVSEYAANKVLLGKTSVTDSMESHAADSYGSVIHYDQATLDGVATGKIGLWQLAYLALHEAMHLYKDPETGLPLYQHNLLPGQTSLTPDAAAYYPYKGTEFYQITHGTPPCVNQ